MEVDRILKDLATGKITVGEALKLLKETEDYIVHENLTLDIRRIERLGMPEVVYAEHKSLSQVTAAAKIIYEKNKRVLITRVPKDYYDYIISAVQETYPNVKIHEDKEASIIAIGDLPDLEPPRVLIVSAGASDYPVVREVYWTLRFLGVETRIVSDIGVAGLHRLQEFLDTVNAVNPFAIIVVAGMDGALPSVIAGLTGLPIIAVPTSVGYGASFNGLAALLTMLNSCSAGVSVVNIDSGFNAAMTAYRIKVAIKKQTKIKE